MQQDRQFTGFNLRGNLSDLALFVGGALATAVAVAVVAMGIVLLLAR